MKVLGAVAATAAVLLTGCATGPGGGMPNPFAGLFAESPAEKALSAGVKQFEEGEYPEAAKNLNAALDAGLGGAADGTRAHKYLAFIHCVSGRPKQCQDEFRKALEINPSFELAPSESGHPLWGPEFRSAKAKSK